MECFIGTILPWPLQWAPWGYSLCYGQILNIAQYQAVYSLLGAVYGGDGKSTFGLPNLIGRVPLGGGTSQSAQTVYLPGQTGGARSQSITINNLPSHTHSATATVVPGTKKFTIPAQKASGAITATAITDVVPGNPGTTKPAANVKNYYLTGVGGSGSGVYTATLPGSDKAGVIGTTVTVDPSGYTAATSAQDVEVPTVTGVGVVVNAAGNQTPPAIQTMPPYQVISFMIALEGIYPVRDF